MAATPNPQDWDIKSRGDQCCKSERKFEDGEEFYSRLVFGEDGYEREDYALSEWSDAIKHAALSSWKSVFRFPPPPKEEALKKENAESMLRELMADEDPASANTIFVLAVMLERKRTLVEKDVQRRDDGVKLRVYEHKQSGETFLIPDPELKLSELELVQEDVAIGLGWKPAPEEEVVSNDELREEGAPEEPQTASAADRDQ